jgi:hypothetical protein
MNQRQRLNNATSRLRNAAIGDFARTKGMTEIAGCQPPPSKQGAIAGRFRQTTLLLELAAQALERRNRLSVYHPLHRSKAPRQQQESGERSPPARSHKVAFGKFRFVP